MKWSWKLGRVFGIDIYLHATFLLLIAWVLYVYWSIGKGFAFAVNGVIFTLVLFGCVVLHELGHALMGRKFGVNTREITLLPIGGVANLERIPEDPRQELLISMAGPAITLVIAALALLWLYLTHSMSSLKWFAATGGLSMAGIMVVNLFLLAFNLLPAFPMDGGRALRALLSMRLGRVRGTRIAAALGQSLAFIFALVGLFSNPFLILIGIFVWIGAAQEKTMVMMEWAFHGLPASKAMITHFSTLSPDDPLNAPEDLILSTPQHDFPVVEEDHLVGMLTRGDLMKGLSAKDGEIHVKDVMHRDFQAVDSSEPLEGAFVKLQESGYGALPVVHDGELVGLLTTDSLGEYLAILSARKIG